MTFSQRVAKDPIHKDARMIGGAAFIARAEWLRHLSEQQIKAIPGLKEWAETATEWRKAYTENYHD
jgi:hypothetical protein